MVPIFLTVYSFIKSNIFLLSFFSGMIAEELVLFLAILAGKGEMPIILVFIGGVFGAILADQIYYFFGRSRFIKYLERKHLVSKTVEVLPKFVKDFGEKNRTFGIFISKFIYGTRGVSLISLGAKKIPYKNFLFSDVIAVFCWACLMIPLAWLSGRGISIFLRITRGLEKFLFICLLFILIYFLAMRIIFVLMQKN